jgi:hypothetical protein
MNVQVHDRLSGYLTDVDAEVVTSRPVAPIKSALHPLEQFINRRPFFRRQIEEAGIVPAQDDQRVPRRHREGIANRHRVRVAVDDPLGRQAAERQSLGLESLIVSLDASLTDGPDFL